MINNRREPSSNIQKYPTRGSSAHPSTNQPTSKYNEDITKHRATYVSTAKQPDTQQSKKSNEETNNLAGKVRDLQTYVSSLLHDVAPSIKYDLGKRFTEITKLISTTTYTKAPSYSQSLHQFKAKVCEFERELYHKYEEILQTNLQTLLRNVITADEYMSPMRDNYIGKPSYGLLKNSENIGRERSNTTFELKKADQVLSQMMSNVNSNYLTTRSLIKLVDKHISECSSASTTIKHEVSAAPKGVTKYSDSKDSLIFELQKKIKLLESGKLLQEKITTPASLLEIKRDIKDASRDWGVLMKSLKTYIRYINQNDFKIAEIYSKDMDLRSEKITKGFEKLIKEVENNERTDSPRKQVEASKIEEIIEENKRLKEQRNSFQKLYEKQIKATKTSTSVDEASQLRQVNESKPGSIRIQESPAYTARIKSLEQEKEMQGQLLGKYKQQIDEMRNIITDRKVHTTSVQNISFMIEAQNNKYMQCLSKISTIVQKYISKIDNMTKANKECISQNKEKLSKQKDSNDANKSTINMLNQQLVDSNKSNQATINGLNKDIAEINESNKSIVSTLKDKMAENNKISQLTINTLNQKIAEYERKDANSKGKPNTNEEEFKKLRDEYATKANQQNSQINNLRNTLLQKEKDILDLQAKFATLEENYNQQTDKHAEEMKYLKDENQNRVNSIHNEEIESLKEEHKHVQQETIKSYEAKLKEAYESAKCITDSKKTVEDQYKQSKANYDAAKEENAQLKEQLETTTQNLNSQIMQYNQCIEKYKGMESQLKEKEESQTDTINKLRADIYNLNENYAIANQKNKKYATSEPEYLNQINALKIELSDKNSSITTQLESIQDMNKQIQTLQDNIATLESLKASNEAELAKLREDMASKNNELVSFTEENTKLKEINSPKLSSNNNASTEQLNTQISQHNEMKMKILDALEIKEENTTDDEIIEQIRHKYQHMLEEVESIKKILSSLNESNNACKNRTIKLVKLIDQTYILTEGDDAMTIVETKLANLLESKERSKTIPKEDIAKFASNLVDDTINPIIEKEIANAILEASQRNAHTTNDEHINQELSAKNEELTNKLQSLTQNEKELNFKIQELTQNISVKTSIENSLTLQIKDLTNQINQFNVKQKDLMTQLDQLNAYKQSQTNKETDTASKLEEMKKQIQTEEEKGKASQATINEHINTEGQLNVRIDELNKQIKAAEGKELEYKDQLSQLTLKIFDYDEKMSAQIESIVEQLRGKYSADAIEIILSRNMMELNDLQSYIYMQQDKKESIDQSKNKDLLAKYETLSKAHQELQSKSEEYALLTEDNDYLKEQNKAQQEQIKELNTKMQSLQSKEDNKEIQSITSNLQKAAQLLGAAPEVDYKGKCAALQKQVDEISIKYNAQSAKDSTKIKELSSQNDKLSDDIETIQYENEVKTVEINKAMKSIQEIKKSQQSITALSTNSMCELKKECIDKMNSICGELQRIGKIYSEHTSKQNDTIEELKKSISQKQENIVQITASGSAKAKEIASLNEQINSLKAQKAKLDIDISKIKKDYDGIKLNSNKINEDLEAERAAYQSLKLKFDKLDDTHRIAKAELEKVKEELLNKTGDYNNKLKEFSELSNASSQSIQGIKADLEIKQTQAQKELDSLHILYTALEQKYKDALISNSELTKNIEEANNTNKAHQSKISTLSEDIKACVGEKEKLVQQLTNKENEYHSAIDDLNKKLIEKQLQSQETIDKLQNDIGNKDKEISSKESALMQMGNQLEEAHKSIQNEANLLKEKLASIYQAHQQEVTSLNEKIGEMKINALSLEKEKQFMQLENENKGKLLLQNHIEVDQIKEQTQTQIKELQLMVQDKERANQENTQIIANKNKEISELKEEYAKQKATHEGIIADIEKKEAILKQQYEQELNTCKQSLQANTSLQVLQQKHEIEKNENTAIMKRLTDELNDLKKRHEQECTDYKNALQVKANELLKYEKESKEYQQTMQTKTEEARNMQAEYDVLLNEKNILQQKYENEAKQLANTSNSDKADITKLRQQYDSEIAQSKEKIVAKENEINALHIKHESTIKEYENTIKLRNTEYNQLQENYKNAQTELNAATEKYNANEINAAKKIEELVNQNELNKSIENEIDILKNTNTLLDQQISEITSSKSKLQSDYDNYKNIIESLKKEAELYKAQSHTHDTQMQETNEALQKQTMHSQQLESTISAQGSQIKELNQLLTQANKQISEFISLINDDINNYKPSISFIQQPIAPEYQSQVILQISDFLHIKETISTIDELCSAIAKLIPPTLTVPTEFRNSDMKRTIEKNANLQFSMSEMEDKNNDLMANVEKLKKEVDINKNEITKFISILPLNKAYIHKQC